MASAPEPRQSLEELSFCACSGCRSHLTQHLFGESFAWAGRHDPRNQPQYALGSRGILHALLREEGAMVKRTPLAVLARVALVGTVSMASGMAVAVDVVTQRNDNFRTGAMLAETTLTTARVNTGQFGKLYTRFVDGDIYAQPLYVGQLDVPRLGKRNVVYVATSK